MVTLISWVKGFSHQSDTLKCDVLGSPSRSETAEINQTWSDMNNIVTCFLWTERTF